MNGVWQNLCCLELRESQYMVIVLLFFKDTTSDKFGLGRKFVWCQWINKLPKRHSDYRKLNFYKGELYEKNK